MLQVLLPKGDKDRSMQLNIESGTSLCAAVKKDKSSDRPYVSDVPPFFMLADGEGEGDHGELAAALATRRMQRCLDEAWSDEGRWRWPLSWGAPPENINPDTPEILLNHARNLTHEYLLNFKVRHKEWSDFSAALTTAFIIGQTLYASHTGSNRIYLCRKNNLQCISLDNSSAMLGDSQSHFDSLERAPTGKVPFLLKKTLAAGDRLLICTKGISTLTYQEIHALITRTGKSSGDLADDLIDAVRAKEPLEDTAVLILSLNRGADR